MELTNKYYRINVKHHPIEGKCGNYYCTYLNEHMCHYNGKIGIVIGRNTHSVKLRIDGEFLHWDWSPCMLVPIERENEKEKDSGTLAYRVSVRSVPLLQSIQE